MTTRSNHSQSSWRIGSPEAVGCRGAFFSTKKPAVRPRAHYGDMPAQEVRLTNVFQLIMIREEYIAGIRTGTGLPRRARIHGEGEASSSWFLMRQNNGWREAHGVPFAM